MHVSLNHYNVTGKYVELEFCIKYFLSFQKHFSVEKMLPSAYAIMTK